MYLLVATRRALTAYKIRTGESVWSEEFQSLESGAGSGERSHRLCFSMLHDMQVLASSSSGPASLRAATPGGARVVLLGSAAGRGVCPRGAQGTDSLTPAKYIYFLKYSLYFEGIPNLSYTSLHFI